MAKIFKAKSTGNRRAKNSRSGQGIEVIQDTIDVVDHHGSGVCNNQQVVKFVEGGLPGELCEVSITEKRKRFWKGSVKKVLSANPHRQLPFCQHFNQCGGCQTQHCEEQAMLGYKQDAVTQLLQRMCKISDINWQTALSSDAQGYRRKTRFAFDARDKSRVKLGYRSKGSAKIIEITSCPILEPDLQALILPLQEMVKSLQTPSVIGHISLIKGGECCQVCIRVVKSISESDKQKLSQWAELHGCDLVIEAQPDQFEILYSSEHKPLNYVVEPGCVIDIQANDFIQVNDQMNRRMVSQAMQWLSISEADVILDLFCGVGNFSLPLARRCKKVYAVEGVSKMVQRAANNALKNGIDNTEFLLADLNQTNGVSAEIVSSCNKVLLDPARDGADEILREITQYGASHILYVSCNPATFARDAAIAIEKGYKIDKICLMDMFPNTAHTELMALFVRNQ